MESRQQFFACALVRGRGDFVVESFTNALYGIELAAYSTLCYRNVGGFGLSPVDGSAAIVECDTSS